MRFSLIVVVGAFAPCVATAFSTTSTTSTLERKGGSASALPPPPTPQQHQQQTESPPLQQHQHQHHQHWRGPWEERFQELLEFQKEHGHCRVPKRYAANKPLANWVSKQRQERRRFEIGEKTSITTERIQALEVIGFCWNTQKETTALIDANGNPNDSRIPAASSTLSSQLDSSSSWNQHLESLVEFLTRHNLSSVAELPKHSEHECWIKQQRRKFLDNQKQHQLTEEQIHKLHQVDPHWHFNRHELVWETRYQELVEYANQHGDCCVPISYAENKKLANWVSNQRKLYSEQLKHPGWRSNSLDERRKQRLEEIGFIWNRWEYEFDRKNVMDSNGRLNL